MLGRCIAQQQSLALARHQGLRYPFGVFIDLRLGRCGHRICTGDAARHIGQGLDPVLWRCRDAGGKRHRPVIVRGIQAHHQPALTRRVAQSQRKQGMVLAQEAANHERPVQGRQRRNRHPQPLRTARRCGVGKVGVPGTEVDALAAQTAYQLSQQMQFFNRAMGRGQRADADHAMLGLDSLQAVGHVGQRDVPLDRAPLTVLLDHRTVQTLVAVERLVAEAVAIGNPAFVDVFVFQRHNPQHLVGLDLDDQVRTRGVMRADALAPRQLPGTRRIAEGLAGERTDRADVDHVARQFAVDGLTDEGGDLAVLAAVLHAEFHRAGHFLAETNATGAVDAAAHLLHRDQRADVLVEDNALFLVIARGPTPVAHRQILQLAFATLIANRAIERVVDEQKLHHRLLGLDDLVGLGVHHHALGHRGRTGRHRLGRFLDVDQAHAAVGRDAELLVVAEMRDGDAGGVGRMHHHAARFNADFLAVEFDFDHVNVCQERPDPSASRRRTKPQPRYRLCRNLGCRPLEGER